MVFECIRTRVDGAFFIGRICTYTEARVTRADAAFNRTIVFLLALSDFLAERSSRSLRRYGLLAAGLVHLRLTLRNIRQFGDTGLQDELEFWLSFCLILVQIDDAMRVFAVTRITAVALGGTLAFGLGAADHSAFIVDYLTSLV